MALRTKMWTTTVAIVVLAILAGFFVYPLPASFPGSQWLNALPIKLGLDLQGGAHLIYQADVSEIASADRGNAVEGVRDVLERRVNALGVSEPIVQTNKTPGGEYRVILELAGIFDVDAAKTQIGETPLLEFKELDEQATSTEMLVDPAVDEQNQVLKKQAQRVLERALGGEDFIALVSEFSQDSGSAQNNGDLGFVGRGAFVDEFEKVLFDDSFEVGMTWPELVETQFGWHIIQKINERGLGDEKEIQSRHILIQRAVSNESNQQWKNTQLAGRQLERAQLTFDSNTNEAQVQLQFDKGGEDLFQEITARNVGKPVAIFLDGFPISVPIVQQEISGGIAVITGQFNIKEAKLLAQRLNAGALPVPIELISQQTIGPSLGQKSVTASVTAGMYGLMLVALFMLVYYRLPGLLAVVTLSIYAVFLLTLFQLLGVTLTLAGIAGFILSLGLAVDANVLIFERLKEELRAGKALSGAIETGFSRAWTSIRDSNISSLLTALILYWFGTSLIRGFAITLGIGILVSMFTAIVVTRGFLRLLPSSERLQWWFGVTRK